MRFDVLSRHFERVDHMQLHEVEGFTLQLLVASEVCCCVAVPTLLTHVRDACIQAGKQRHKLLAEDGECGRVEFLAQSLCFVEVGQLAADALCGGCEYEKV